MVFGKERSESLLKKAIEESVVSDTQSTIHTHDEQIDFEFTIKGSINLAKFLAVYDAEDLSWNYAVDLMLQKTQVCEIIHSFSFVLDKE